MKKSPETMDFTRMVTLHDIAIRLWGAQVETPPGTSAHGPSGGPQTRRGSDLHRPDRPIHCNFIGNMTIT
jgi:hypothetical protein